MKIDLHTHILPKTWPDLDAKYGYAGFVRLDHYKPCCARMIIRAAREQGFRKVARTLAVFPGSGGVGRRIETPDPRLGGESIAEVFRSVGGAIRQSWCGPCFGQGPDSLTKGERAITSFNRNWQNRMGIGGEGYLASPAVVASSALLGYMAPPGELGLAWEPERFA